MPLSYTKFGGKLSKSLFGIFVALAACVCCATVWADTTSQTLNARPVRDTTLDSRQKDKNFGTETTLRLQYVAATSTSESGQAVALLYFDLSQIPAKAVIDQAEVQLFVEDVEVVDTATLKLGQVQMDWDEELKWNPQGLPPMQMLLAKTYSNGEATALKSRPLTLGTDNANLRKYVQDSVSGERVNQGLALYTDAVNEHLFVFGSGESADADHEPQLNLTYHVPAELLITNLETSDLLSDSIAITWNTNKPATSYVSYGKTQEYGSTSGLDTYITAHKVVLTDLEPNTTYHYKIKSQDAEEEAAESDDRTFTTDVVVPEDEEQIPATIAEDPPTQTQTQKPTSTPVAAAAASTKNQTPSSGKGDLSLQDGEDYSKKPSLFDKYRDLLLVFVPVMGAILLIVVIFRHTIGNYLGAPEETVEEEAAQSAVLAEPPVNSYPSNGTPVPYWDMEPEGSFTMTQDAHKSTMQASTEGVHVHSPSAVPVAKPHVGNPSPSNRERVLDLSRGNRPRGPRRI